MSLFALIGIVKSKQIFISIKAQVRKLNCGNLCNINYKQLHYCGVAHNRKFRSLPAQKNSLPS